MVTLGAVLRAAVLSRLALALLALFGFSVPAAEREADRVVQRAAGGPERRKPAEAAPVAIAAVAPVHHGVEATTLPPPRAGTLRAAPRRYLLHRAWLN